jgi:hypothetical protein
MMHIKNLFLTILADDNDFIDVLMRLSYDALLVDEGKDA